MLRADRFGLIVAAIAIAPHAALAEVPACRVPSALPSARVEVVPPGARRVRPIAGYLLALSWSPEYCAARGRRDPVQCGGTLPRFGFILHGLWPEASGPAYPQYCAPARALPPAIIRANFCATPSVQLQQHQWAKHGVCMTPTPQRYFDQGRRLFALVRYPDMESEANSRTTVGAFARRFAESNPGMPATAVRIQRSPSGWLQEVRICLSRSFRLRACPAHVDGARANDTLRVRRQR